MTTFRILNSDDAQSILALDIKYLDSDLTLDQIINKIIPHNFVGIFLDDILQGYCECAQISQDDVKIEWMCANKRFGALLYYEIEHILAQRYRKISLYVSLEGQYAISRLNFWPKMGFKVRRINPITKELYMEKSI